MRRSWPTSRDSAPQRLALGRPASERSCWPQRLALSHRRHRPNSRRRAASRHTRSWGLTPRRPVSPRELRTVPTRTPAVTGNRTAVAPFRNIAKVRLRQNPRNRPIFVIRVPLYRRAIRVGRANPPLGLRIRLESAASHTGPQPAHRLCPPRNGGASPRRPICPTLRARYLDERPGDARERQSVRASDRHPPLRRAEFEKKFGARTAPFCRRAPVNSLCRRRALDASLFVLQSDRRQPIVPRSPRRQWSL